MVCRAGHKAKEAGSDAMLRPAQLSVVAVGVQLHNAPVVPLNCMPSEKGIKIKIKKIGTNS